LKIFNLKFTEIVIWVFQELPEGEWFCGQDCKHIHSILSLLVSNGPEPLADSIISKVLKSQPRLDKSEEAAESNIATFEWQLLHGRGGDPSNGKTLAEAVQIFSVRNLLDLSHASFLSLFYCHISGKNDPS